MYDQIKITGFIQPTFKFVCKDISNSFVNFKDLLDMCITMEQREMVIEISYYFDENLCYDHANISGTKQLTLNFCLYNISISFFEKIIYPFLNEILDGPCVS